MSNINVGNQNQQFLGNRISSLREQIARLRNAISAENLTLPPMNINYQTSNDIPYLKNEIVRLQGVLTAACFTQSIQPNTDKLPKTVSGKSGGNNTAAQCAEKYIERANQFPQ